MSQSIKTPVLAMISPDKTAVKGYSIENCGVAGCRWTFIYTLAQFVGIAGMKADSAKRRELFQTKLMDILCLMVQLPRLRI